MTSDVIDRHYVDRLFVILLQLRELLASRSTGLSNGAHACATSFVEPPEIEFQ